MFSPDQWKNLNLEFQRAIGEALQSVAPIPRSCLNCEHFLEESAPGVALEVCGLTNGLRPPARVIANGCDKWKHDDCPF